MIETEKLNQIHDKSWTVQNQADYEIQLGNQMARLVVGRIVLGQQIELHNTTEHGFSADAIKATDYMVKVLNGAIFGLYIEMLNTPAHGSARIYAGILEDYVKGENNIIPMSSLSPLDIPRFLNSILSIDYANANPEVARNAGGPYD